MNRTVQNLLNIAISQIGYKEKASNSNLDSNTANAGSGNFTKYARDLHNAGYYGGANKNGYAWCDMFVDWCFYKLCGNRDDAQRMTCQTGPYGAGCGPSAQYYKNKGRLFYSNPKPGDQIFFGNGNNIGHTGIVERVSGGIVYTIEGNTTDSVARRRYNISSDYVKCYGRPIYDGDSGEVAPTNPITPKPVNPTPVTPSKPTLDVDKYTVHRGDSWWGIANSILGDGNKMHELAEYNGKTIAYILQPGDVLRIPGKDNKPTTPINPKPINPTPITPKPVNPTPVTPSKPVNPNTSNDKEYEDYTIKVGDTLWGIASKHMGSGLKMQELADYNNINLNDIIYPGQKLKIPK